MWISPTPPPSLLPGILARHVFTTMWNQVGPSGTKSGSKPFAWNSGTSCFTTMWIQVDPNGSESGSKPFCLEFWHVMFLQPCGSKWIRIRIRALSLGILAKSISSRTLIIILIKSPASRIQGPQNGNCRILQKGAGGSPLIHSRAALHSLITGKQHPGTYLRRALEQCSS